MTEQGMRTRRQYFYFLIIVFILPWCLPQTMAASCPRCYFVSKVKLVLENGTEKEVYLQIYDDWLGGNESRDFKPGKDLAGFLRSEINKNRQDYTPPEKVSYFMDLYVFKGVQELEKWQGDYKLDPEHKCAQGTGNVMLGDKDELKLAAQEDIHTVTFDSIKSIIVIARERGLSGAGDIPHLKLDQIHQWENAQKYFVQFYAQRTDTVFLVCLEPDYSQEEFYLFVRYYLNNYTAGFCYNLLPAAKEFYGLSVCLDDQKPIDGCLKTAKESARRNIKLLSGYPFKNDKIRSYMEEVVERYKARLSFYNALSDYIYKGETESLSEFIKTEIKSLSLREKMRWAIKSSPDRNERIEVARDLIGQLFSPGTKNNLTTVPPAMEKKALKTLNILTYYQSWE